MTKWAFLTYYSTNIRPVCGNTHNKPQKVNNLTDLHTNTQATTIWISFDTTRGLTKVFFNRMDYF